VGLALGLTSGTAVLALARGEGAGTQEALVGALFVAAILGTSPYWIEDFLGYLAFRAALYTAVFWVPAVVFALVVFYAFRILADRRWTVEAVSSDSPWTATRWQVRGWRRSGRVARQIAVALERGDEPLPAAADGVPETIVAGMS
jgi:apolipoprotein N-acyltransferase